MIRAWSEPGAEARGIRHQDLIYAERSRAELRPRTSPGSWGGVYQPVYADGQVADADAGSVVDGIGDRGRGADDADLADSLGPGGPMFR